jgi:hypothetical protein
MQSWLEAVIPVSTPTFSKTLQPPEVTLDAVNSVLFGPVAGDSSSLQAAQRRKAARADSMITVIGFLILDESISAPSKNKLLI